MLVVCLAQMDLNKAENLKAELKSVELARDRSQRELERTRTRLDKLESHKAQSVVQVDRYLLFVAVRGVSYFFLVANS